MDRRSRMLASLAVAAWTATALAHLVVVSTTDETERIEWTERRNLCLLCASLATNTLAFTTGYRHVKRLRR